MGKKYNLRVVLPWDQCRAWRLPTQRYCFRLFENISHVIFIIPLHQIIELNGVWSLWKKQDIDCLVTIKKFVLIASINKKKRCLFVHYSNNLRLEGVMATSYRNLLLFCRKTTYTYNKYFGNIKEIPSKCH